LVLLVQDVRIEFEKQLEYGTGTLYASDTIRTVHKQETAYDISEGSLAIINFDKFHSMMGHPHNGVLKETAKANKINRSSSLSLRPLH
jgi:hypothetical protein